MHKYLDTSHQQVEPANVVLLVDCNMFLAIGSRFVKQLFCSHSVPVLIGVVTNAALKRGQHLYCVFIK